MKENIKNYKLAFLKMLLQVIFQKMLEVIKNICLPDNQISFSASKKKLKK